MQSLNSLVRSKVASPARRCPTTQCYNVAQHWAEPIQWPSQLQHQQLPRYYRPPLQKKPSSGQLSTQLAATSESGVQAVAPTAAMMTCKRCKQRFSAEQNTKTSCSYHPALYSGGEVAKVLLNLQLLDTAPLYCLILSCTLTAAAAVC